jgi:hypothetical protein
MLIILSLAFLIRMVWIILVNPVPISDFSFYYNQGISISQGHGYKAPDNRATAFWPVGYPAFLAILFYLFGPSLFVGKFANTILSVGTLLLFYRFALLISNGKRTSMLATTIVAFFPSQIAYCSLISDTILFQFLLYSGLYFLSSRTSSLSAFLSGTIFGLSMLVRPYSLLVPLIYPIACWRSRSPLNILKRISYIYFGIILVVLPWTIRNYIEFGGFVLISNNGGFNLLIGNSPYATGRYNDLKIESGQYNNEFELDHAARKMAVEYIFSHPVRTLLKSIPKLYYMYNDDSNSIWWNLAGYRYKDSTPPGQHFKKKDLPWVVIFQGYYFVVLLGFTGFLFRNFILKKQTLKVHPLGLFIIMYFTVIAIIFFGDPRFRFPIDPVLALYSSAFFLSFAKRDHKSLLKGSSTKVIHGGN